jgi:hypothetical protein
MVTQIFPLYTISNSLHIFGSCNNFSIVYVQSPLQLLLEVAVYIH